MTVSYRNTVFELVKLSRSSRERSNTLWNFPCSSCPCPNAWHSTF